MINIKSNHLIYAFFAASMAYMFHIATTLQHFFIMLFIATALPAMVMAFAAPYKKWEEHKRRANYYENQVNQ